MRTVLITGASRGIGAAAARAFAQNGDRVMIHYHKQRALAQALCEQLRQAGAQAACVQADVAERAQVQAMLAQTERQFGPVEVLVNNAGIAQQALFTDVSEAEWDRMFAVNVKGMFHCTQGVLGKMISQKRGKIVNISSMWGQIGASCEVSYSAAKAAVIGLTKALAKEVGPSGIQVNCVAPGVIDTEMNAALDASTRAMLAEETPLGVLGTAEDVARAIVFLASPQADFITGQVLGVNGGFVI